MLKAIRKSLSAPWWVYLILSSITIVCLIIGFVFGSSLLSNVGYSLMASVIVAFVVDIGNTKVAHQREEREFTIITAEYYHSFMRLREKVVEISEYRDGLNIGEKHTFSEWLTKAAIPEFDEKDLSLQEFENILLDLRIQIGRIGKAADSLEASRNQYINNSLFTEEFRRQLKRVLFMTGDIDRHFERGEFREAIHIIDSHLIPFFVKNNPGYGKYFTEEYNTEEDNQ